MKKFFVTLAIIACLGTNLFAADKSSRPNIVFILADDLGIPGIGCCGGEFKTPNLDALAAGGIRFDRCFAAPLCAPSRALCLTGRYGFRTGVLDNSLGGKAKPQKEVCIAKTLKQAGYATCVAGKWRQLTYFTTVTDGAAWGFDEFMIWGVSFDADKGERYWDPVYNHNGRPLKDTKDKYGPDLLHDFAVDFIRRHRDHPFFLYYPMPLIHAPILRTPDTASGVTDHKALYADNIAYMDKLVGKLVAELDRLNLREKTLIVFSGDNGSVEPGSVHGRKVDGVKHELNEGGSRVPLIANWKGTTPAGKVLNDLVDFTDFYVTFAEFAGAKLPGGVKLDGHSFAPQLRGEKGVPREWIYIQLGQKWYARNDGWKLNETGELYDMSNAPFGEKLVSPDRESSAAKNGRKKLQAVLDELNPGAEKDATAPETPIKKGRRQLKRQQGAGG